MVDPHARSALAAVVDGYLSEQLTAFQFDERLHQIRNTTKDGTLHAVADALWLVYDDIVDHKVVMDRDGWDVIQRLMLVLHSGAELRKERQWVWHPSQALALLCLAAMPVACWPLGQHWFPVFMLGGALSMVTEWWRDRALRRHGATDPWKAWPFSSPGAIRRALRRAPGFRKRRHRPEVARRQIRSRLVQWAYGLQFRFLWCMLSPLVLLVQCLPLSISRTLVGEPAGCEGWPR